MARFAYVGCWTSAGRGARGRGIAVYEIDNAGGWLLIQTLDPVQANPSWLTLNKQQSLLHAVHGDGNLLATYRRHPVSGRLTLLGTQSTGPQNTHPALDPEKRNNPAHVSYDPSERYLLVANHEAGNVAVFPIGDEGRPMPASSWIPIPGHLSDRYPSLSRPHEIVFDHQGRHFALPIQGRRAGDGIDMLRIYAFNDGQCTLTDDIQPAAGSWPRHVDFHPGGRFLYLLSELGNTIEVFDYDGTSGTLALRQSLGSVPSEYAGRSDASEIEVHPNGRFLYAANRGHDSIGIFRIDDASGTLAAVGWVDCGGKTPRATAFSPDGLFFYSANEDSDTLTEFSVNTTSGILASTGRVINTPSPSCIVFAG